MRCVVTGGSGFLGSRLVQLLSQAGHKAVAVSRRTGHDVRDPESLKSAFTGADAVYHLAALVQSRPGPFEETNLEGLLNVLRLCRQLGVQRFINVSSFTIFGPSGQQPHVEKSFAPRSEFFHGYDETKYRGYLLASEWRERIPMNNVFPTVIYGPGPMTEGNILVRLLRRWKRLRVAPLQRDGLPVWNFAFVDDVADGLVRCLQAPVGRDYILGGEDASLRRLAQEFQEVSGAAILRLGLSDRLFLAGTYAEDAASRLFRFPPLVLPATAQFFLHDWRFSSLKAEREFDYRPRPLRQGLERTFRWMRDQRIA